MHERRETEIERDGERDRERQTPCQQDKNRYLIMKVSEF